MTEVQVVAPAAEAVAPADLWVVPLTREGGAAPKLAALGGLLGCDLGWLGCAPDAVGLGRRTAVAVPRAGGSALRLVLAGLGAGGLVDGYLLRNVTELAIGDERADCAAVLLDRETLGALRVTGELGAAAAVRFALEGAVRAGCDWGRAGDGGRDRLERVLAVSDALDSADAQRVAGDARLLGELTTRVRRWQWAPANRLTPRTFAAEAARLGAAAGLAVSVLDGAALGREGYGGILGVAQGSAEPPRLVEVRHRAGGGAGPVLGLVGKGVTFDAGGMALKPSRDLHLMKTDMSAAGAVLGALLAVAAWRLPIDVVGVLPLSENVPGTGSLHPGDVITLAGGTDVEVVNPDAEGRLLLGDGLVHARRAGATHLVSLGTLTDGVTMAQGPTASGLLGDDPEFVARVEAAARRAGERTLRLAIHPELERVLASDVATVRNEADDLQAEPVAAAIFLRRFAGGLPWAHLDIGGSASNEHEVLYQVVPRGPSAVATATLAELARDLATPGAGDPGR